MTCLCLLDSDPQDFPHFGILPRPSPPQDVAGCECVFNASSTRLQCVFNASSMHLQCVFTPARDCCSQSSSSPPQVQKIFSKNPPISKKVQNDPTQICPLGTHEQQFFGFLFEAFRRGKMGGVIFFKIARARARTGPRASRAQNQGRPAQIAQGCIFSTFGIFGTS